MQAAGRAYHNPDPNAADTAFKGGSKENEPGEWDFTTEKDGVNPGKANIRDAWSAVDQDGAETFVYLGFAREEAGGTTFLAFELNHDSRLWNNGRADIPCRRTGDLLVAYEPQGNNVDVFIQRWVTARGRCDDGVREQGTASTTSSGLTPNVDAQGAINAAAIAARLPGAYSGTVPAERFGEAALNLGRILGEALEEPLFLVQLGLDALAVLQLGLLEHAGLRGAEGDRRAQLRRFRHEVPRPERQRPS